MIARYVVHIEYHRGYRPRFLIKRAPRPGDRVVDGGISGTLRRCSECGEGFLMEPDHLSMSELPPFPEAKEEE